MCVCTHVATHTECLYMCVPNNNGKTIRDIGVTLLRVNNPLPRTHPSTKLSPKGLELFIYMAVAPTDAPD